MEGYDAGFRRRARSPKAAAAVVLMLVLTGCSPRNQGEVFRDPDSGQPALFVALCEGEHIDAVELTIDGAPEGHGVLWRVERGPDAPSLDEVAMGVVPPGYHEVVTLQESELPTRSLELTAELSGGGAAEAGESFRESSLPDGTPEDVASLREAASDNCSLVPASLPDPLALLAPLLLAVAALVAIRGRAALPLSPRVGRQSAWRWSFGFAVIGAGVVLLLVGSGTRNEPLRFLGIGSALGFLLVVCALVGRRLRRSERGWAAVTEVLLVLAVAFFFVVPATVYFGITEGGFFDCGEGWTFDCSPSWLDRVLLLAPLALAWVTAVLAGEGGWWPSGREPADATAVSVGRPPVKRGVALLVVLVVSLVKMLVIADGGEEDRLDLVAAANVCEVDLIGDLLARGADPNVRGVVSESSEAEYPLEVAASYCGAPAIEALLAAGASPDLPADHPPLAVAIESGNGDAVDVLLDAGADPNWAGADGRTLVWTAADDGETAIVSALIEAGARGNEPDNGRAHTPLFRAVMGDHVAVVEQLLAAGADPNRRGELSWFDIGTYVYSLDEEEQVRVVESLGPALDLEPDVLSRFEPGDFTQAATMLDVVDDPSESVGSFPPLYMATVRGDAQMVEALLAAGADPAIGTDPTGHLPYQAAEMLGRADLVALLQPE